MEYTPIIFTSIQNQSNPYNYCLYGMALLTGGLVQVVATNGIGLVTGGLVWQGPIVWFDPQAANPISTGWTACFGYAGSTYTITTGWTAMAGYIGSSSTITTTWSSSQEFGDEFPI